ncbi:MAG: efflux transporter periplasmic adaptor subunit, partial [Rufibacter sp.]
MDRIIEKKRWTPKKIITYVAIAAVLGLLTYVFALGDNSSKLNVEAQKITMSTVSQGSFQEFIPVDGTVHPIKTILIPAVEGGTVDQKYLEGGKPVQA